MSWIMTSTGQRLWVLEGGGPVAIEDVAAGLAKACRFAGQCRGFYSVAQHSVLASWEAEPRDALRALLHDASEAFLGDLPTPVKKHLQDYRLAEQALQHRIYHEFGVDPGDWEAWERVREVDLRLFATEARDLMPPWDGWSEVAEPYAWRIEPGGLWSWQDAQEKFLERYEQLRGSSS